MLGDYLLSDFCLILFVSKLIKIIHKKISSYLQRHGISHEVKRQAFQELEHQYLEDFNNISSKEHEQGMDMYNFQNY